MGVNRVVVRQQLRAVVVAVALSSTAISVVLEPTAHTYPGIAVLEVLVIVGFAAAGQLLLLDPTQRRNGHLLVTTALLQFLTHLHLVDHSPFPFIAWLSGPLSAVPVSAVLLRFPSEKLDRTGRRWVIFQTVWLTTSRLLFTVPPPERRIGWWPAIETTPSVAAIGSIIGNSVLIVSTVFFGYLLVRRLLRSRGLARHEMAPIMVAALAATATVVVAFVSVADSRTGVPPLILAVEQLGLFGIPVAFMISAISMRMARAAVGDLLLNTNYSTTAAELRNALATTLADPGLVLLVWNSKIQRWTTSDEKIADVSYRAPGQLLIPVDGPDGAPLGALVTDGQVVRHRHLLDATIAAARLSLHNAAVLAEVRESRTRIAEAGLSERRRLVRDLHDGAQQRLLALGISLDQVQRAASDPRTQQLADRAVDEVHLAIQELRELARGIHPAVLSQHGLAAAVESAVANLPITISTSIPTLRWPAVIEATAYFAICEALNNVVKHSGADGAQVVVDDRDHHLTVEVRDEGRGGAVLLAGSGLVGIHDRIAALGGSMQLFSPEGGGSCLTLSIPYASQ